MTTDAIQTVFNCAHLAFLPGEFCVFDPKGSDDTTLTKSLNGLREIWGRKSLVVVNAPLVRDKLFGDRPFREARHFDVLELFAFVRPAQFCAPSITGLANYLAMGEPKGAFEQAKFLRQIVDRLFNELRTCDLAFRLMALSSLGYMQARQWP